MTPKPPFKVRLQDASRKRVMHVRDIVEDRLHWKLRTEGFRSVRTPSLVVSPGMEPHIRPVKIEGRERFLPTSPEFAMKKLLAGGFEKIYQICQVFRNEPVSPYHLPEFTMLEYYASGWNLENLMGFTEDLLKDIFENCSPDLKCRYGKGSGSWEVKTPRQLFRQYCNFDLVDHPTQSMIRKQCERLGIASSSIPESADWNDLYFLIWLNFIEPNLPRDRPFFIKDYPACQSALAETDRDADGFCIAKRFEIYLEGMEVGNAFQELRDPKEQIARFEKDMKRREELYGDSFPPTPVDPEFIQALNEGLPICSGIAIGVDRLVMAVAQCEDISYTVWFPSTLE